LHERLRTTVANELLRPALERTALGLFAFGRYGGGRLGFPAAVEQHETILEGLRSDDPARARKAFVESALKLGNENDRLDFEAVEGAVPPFA